MNYSTTLTHFSAACTCPNQHLLMSPGCKCEICGGTIESDATANVSTTASKFDAAYFERLDAELDFTEIAA